MIFELRIVLYAFGLLKLTANFIGMWPLIAVALALLEVVLWAWQPTFRIPPTVILRRFRLRLLLRPLCGNIPVSLGFRRRMVLGSLL